MKSLFKNLKAIANSNTGDSLKQKSNPKPSWLSQVAGLFFLLTASQLFMSSKAEAVPLSLKRQFLGYYDYVSTGGTLRTGSDASGNFCAVTNSNTAPLSGIPASATIKAAYLYWAGSGDTADTSVTFQGQNVNADQVYTDTFSLGSTNYRWFGGVADVTSIVAANLNSNYTFADLSVATGSPWCDVRGVLSGWSLIVVYEDSTTVTRPNAINLYDGLSVSRNTFQDFTLSGINVSNAPVSKFTTLIWEGDESLGGSNEFLSFEGNTISDSSNPSNNPFNSSMNVRSLGADSTYGVDLDTFDVSAHTTPGATSLTGRISSNNDLVILGAAVVGVTTFAADLEVTKTVSNPSPVVGQNITYTVTVTNTGPDDTTGVVVKDVLPSQVTHVSNDSSSSYNPTNGNWNVGNLNVGESKTLNITVTVNAGGTFSNTAEVTASDLIDLDSTPNNNATAEDDQASVTVTTAVTSTISGTLYEDSNGNDTLDANESKLPADITVNLLNNSDNSVIKSTTTDANGAYTLTDVADDDYKIQVDTTDTDIPDGYTLSTPNNSPVTVSGSAVTDQDFAFDNDNRPLGGSFTCNATFYITIGNSGGPQQLYDIDRSGSTFNFIPRGQVTDTSGGYPTKFDYNALAYNPLDNYIYAHINTSNATSGPYSAGNVVKIGNDGILHSLGKPTNSNGDTLSGGFIAATILSDGTYVIGSSGAFATLDLTTTPPTITNSQTSVAGLSFTDFAVDPKDPASLSGKRVYMVNENGSQDRLVIVDMTTFPPQITSQANNPTGQNHNAGSQFVDAFGTLYYRSNSNQKLYQVNTDPNSPDYGKATEITTAPSGGNHDGASCLFATAMEKEVEDKDGNLITEIPAGETVKYVYKIATGNVLDLNGVTFTDDLRSVSGGSPVNGKYTGNVTVSNGTGNVSFGNDNQTLTITNLTLPGQVQNQDANGNPIAETLTITAEVTVPKTTTPGTYNNQSFLTNLPIQYPSSIPSDYPRSATFEDPTPIEVTEPIATDPKVLLVKRITGVNGNTTTNGGDSLAGYINEPDDLNAGGNPYDDNDITVPDPANETDPQKDTDKWPDLNTFLIGGINGGQVDPDDELEYTIYFLSAGDTEAKTVLVCDRVPTNTSFMPTAFNDFSPQATGGLATADRGIIWQYNNIMQSLTNAQDGDAGQYFPPGVDPKTVYPNIDCGGENTNGAVVVNLGDLPNATAPGDPTNSYGFVRFKGKVK